MLNKNQSDTSSKPVHSLAITVLAGGPSSERDVSLISGKAVADALKGLGHRVEILDITPADLSALDVPADVIFPALHGHFGEDGQVQRILEARGLPYVGCGPAASALAMDKVATKQACARAGVPTADYQLVTSDQRNAALRNWASTKVCVKPVDQGSSVDTFIVPDQTSLAESLDRVVGRYGQALVERFISGPELTVGVLGTQVLPVIQIVPQGERTFYDYQAKYKDDNTRYLVNPPLPADLIQQVQKLTMTVFQTVGCRDLSRIDWLIEKATGQPYLLEVNTLPGFTSHSLLPKAAGAVGIDFASLCQRLVEMALRRGPQSAAA
jgi:D-alanine-D-alanine ligase